MGEPRIIFLNRVYRPSEAATAQLLTDLAEGLARRGWSVHVITTGATSELQHGVTLHRTGDGEQHGGLFSRTRNYWQFIFRARRRLAGLLQPGDIVVAMTDPPLLGAAVAGLARSRGAHVVHWVQDVYPEIVSAHLGAWAAWVLFPLRRKRDAAWRCARTCVVLGETMAKTVAGRRIPDDRIAVIPNWAPRELQLAATSSDIAAQRLSWGLSEKFIVAYSGNLGRVHEFNAVVDAAEILRDRTDLVFLFIGTGARLADVRSAVDARRLPNIRFLPPAPREKLAVSLAAADVQLVTLKTNFAPLVYPSKLAGVLAAGRPVLFVGPTDGEIARWLDREGCGATVAPDDGVRLAATLIEWQTDPKQQRAGLARTAYEKHFTFEAALTKWEAVLRSDQTAPRVKP